MTCVRSAQILDAKSPGILILYRVALNLWVLSVERVSSYHGDAQSFSVASRCLEHLCSSGLDHETIVAE